MEKIDLAKFKMVWKDELIAAAELHSVSFAAYAAQMREGAARAFDEGALARLYNRVMISARIRLIPARDGAAALRISAEEVPLLPLRAGNALAAAASDDPGAPGEILVKGDGIDKPLLYRLGQPIKWQKQTVSELEFQAKTYGQIEDAAAEPFPFLRTVKLLAGAALPVMEEGRLLRSPDSLIEQISLADGLYITQEILPLFLSDGLN